MAQLIDVKGKPTRERQNLPLILNKEHATGTVQMRPGPLRLTLENRTLTRTVDQVAAQRPKPRQRAILIDAREPTESGHVRRQDSG